MRLRTSTGHGNLTGLGRFGGIVAVTVTLFGVATFSTFSAVSAADIVVTKKSPHSVTKTLDRLANILTAKGITVFTRVDHAAGAKTVEMDLPPTQLLIFGNPKLGTPLMQANRAVGLDLPMKALAWQDDNGQVFLSYTAPAALEQRHGLSERAAIFKKMTGALNNLTNAAIKAE